jgi:hypothetical protein
MKQDEILLELLQRQNILLPLRVSRKLLCHSAKEFSPSLIPILAGENWVV